MTCFHLFFSSFKHVDDQLFYFFFAFFSFLDLISSYSHQENQTRNLGKRRDLCFLLKRTNTKYTQRHTLYNIDLEKLPMIYFHIHLYTTSYYLLFEYLKNTFSHFSFHSELPLIFSTHIIKQTIVTGWNFLF